MPNRIIKESIRTSKTINELTDFQFRLWLYLITYVDDYGRGSADPELLKGFVFPRRKRITETAIQDALADLASMGCINLYCVDGESYFCFPNWSEHQRVRTKISKFPAPENGEKQDVATCGNLQQSAASCGELQQSAAGGGQNPESRIQNTESESGKRKSEEKEPAAADSPHRASARHKYGEYQNVMLSDTDFDKLKSEFPVDYQQRIDRLSEYMASTGKTYKNHLATIRNWAKRDTEKNSVSGRPGKSSPSYWSADELDTFYQMARNWAEGG